MMYYADDGMTGDLELSQADNNGQGMGFLPLLIPLLGAGIGLATTLLAPKEKKEKGPTKEEIAAAMQAQEAAQRKKYILYGAIGVAGLLVIGGAIYLARRK